MNSFLTQYNKKWNKSCRIKDVFAKHNASFLETNFKFTFKKSNQLNENELENYDDENEAVTVSDSLKRGRPRLKYEDSSIKTKRRRALELASKYSKEELEHALKIKEKECDLATEGETNSETVCNEADNNNFLNQVLAMYLDLDLTKSKYDNSRTHNSVLYGDKLHPTYPSMCKAKNNCYPENIRVSKLGASVHLISLLEHTTKRILLTLNEKEFDAIKNRELILLGKWGMDGSSGQQNTRQNWKNEALNLMNDSDFSDEDSYLSDNEIISLSDNSVFMITFVPILLKTANQVIWSNKNPASPLFCRPIKFMFVKETDKLTMKIYNKYSSLLNKIEKYEFEFKGHLFVVKFDLHCTMIDGKVCNVLTLQKATTRCNICGVGPKFINDLRHVTNLPCNPDLYKFGLSSLHCWIRFMEYILHVAYSLDIITGEKEKDKTKKIKKKGYSKRVTV
ncbi:hypothetical protein TSAR_001075 [Trichomalopsis sarcophagae]|uniref:Uncharacterized protein n=1 Tax=Trichomalopsis sarcophagae TaxID=543379 RepID=A0A232EN61_9HYME|nr:hypothetical protein TSAR_001075 [Trichomalopsis sarcophagae]